MHDMLRETPIYQEILKEGREEGLEQGLEQGLQRGQLEVLRHVLVKVSVAHTAEEAKQQLLALNEVDE